MIFEYALLEAEYLLIDRKLRTQIWSRTRLFRIAQFVSTIFWIVLLAAFIFAFTLFGDASSSAVISMHALILFIAVIATAIKLLQESAYRSLIVDRSHLLNQQWTATVTDDNISFNATGSSMVYRWQGIDSVVEVDGAVAIFFSQAAYMPIAASAFVNQVARDIFLQFAAARIALARNAPHALDGTIDDVASPMPAKTEIQTN